MTELRDEIISLRKEIDAKIKEMEKSLKEDESFLYETILLHHDIRKYEDFRRALNKILIDKEDE